MKAQVTGPGTAAGTSGNRTARPGGNRVPPLRGNRYPGPPTTTNTKEINTTMTITPLNSRNSKPTGPAALEERLTTFGLHALIKIAAAAVTTDRGIALQVATTITALPFDENVNEDQLAPALDRLATLAAAQAAQLRDAPGEGHPGVRRT